MDHFVITCVKLGTKYPSDMVNNLYRMCKEHITSSFELICYTDDKYGIDPEVNIIPYVDYGLDIKVYNKLFLFSEQVDKQLPEGPRVFFDLDLVIKSNIDDVISYNKGHLSVIDAEWRKKYDYGFPTFHHPFNSSCMTWQSPQTRPLWDHLMSDPEMFMNKYHWGMDSFMFYEKDKISVEIGYFPHRRFYSYLYGVDNAENKIHDPVSEGYRPSKFIDIVKSIPVVLLNGPTTHEDYMRVFKRHYSV